MSAADPRAACARSWEVGAARDGRLLPKDRESLQRHLATCDVCRDEQQQLQTLAESLRDLPPLPDDALAARRLRHRLLADANRWMVGQAPAERRPARAVWTAPLLAAAALVALVALAVGYRALGSGAARGAITSQAVSSASQQPGDARVDIEPQAGAKWQTRQLGDELRIELDAGEIAASIGPHRPQQLVRIRLPDGWIDDLGTVLVVRVEDGHTTSVRVNEGRVRLRLDGRDPVELGAGENWTTEPAASPHAVMPPHRTVSPPPATPSSTAHAASARSSVPTTPLAAEEAALAARQAREEDEAYLHIVALARAHQPTEARAAAKDYLRRFPNGFRREEVLGVATH
jgi:hypothetical protein